MDKAIFTEDMTVDEFKAKVLELDTPEKRQEAAISLINVLGAKLDSGDWEFIDNLGIAAGPETQCFGVFRFEKLG